MRSLAVYSSDALLLDDLGDEIQTGLDFGRDRLEQLALIMLGDRVFAQAQNDVLRMGHRFDTGNVNSLHLFDQPEYACQLTERSLRVRLLYRNPRQMRNALHVIYRQCHKSPAKPLNNRNCIGYYNALMRSTISFTRKALCSVS